MEILDSIHTHARNLAEVDVRNGVDNEAILFLPEMKLAISKRGKSMIILVISIKTDSFQLVER